MEAGSAPEHDTHGATRSDRIVGFNTVDANSVEKQAALDEKQSEGFLTLNGDGSVFAALAGSSATIHRTSQT